MLIHRIGAFKHPFKILKSDRDGNNQADGRPHGIASADKIPEFKHVFGINAELLHLFCIRRQRHKMLGNRMFAQGVNQPFAAGSGIGKRFNGRKGLGRNDKQRRLGINLVQNLGTGRSVNIGNEIAVDVLGPVFAQSLAGHNRPQVRTADAYIDDIGQLLPVCPLNSPKRTASENFFIFAKTSLICGMTFCRQRKSAYWHGFAVQYAKRGGVRLR